MSLFEQLFGHAKHKDKSALLPTIERAVSAVEPLLKHESGYPERFRKPVEMALEYAHSLALLVPGPLELTRESYVSDPLIHAVFPSAEFITEAFCSSRFLQDYYREFPAHDELYALMGMRRFEKTVLGMEASGDVVVRDVVQKVVFFTTHTIENCAPTEQQAREKMALSFFNSLVKKVKIRVDLRKQEMRAKKQEKDILASRLRAADAITRPAIEAEMRTLLYNMQSAARSADLSSYIEDFETVLSNPQQHLQLNQTPIILDRMGVRRENSISAREEAISFSELTDYDRRIWTVTMVHCRKPPDAELSPKLGKEYRTLAI